MERLRNWWLAATTLPLLAFNPRLRSLLTKMRTFCRALPSTLEGPLPDTLHRLTPSTPRLTPQDTYNEPTIRTLADLAALLDHRSPLGLCLRRSLTRYHFLRRIGLPVVLQFGAKFVTENPDRQVTGHAWLTLYDHPYHEHSDNWQGFTVMFSFPPNSESDRS